MPPITGTSEPKRCGEHDYKCGICKRCQKEADERWNRIWKQKYGEQEARYYSQSPSDRQAEYSPKQSSLVTNWPIADEVCYLAGTARAAKSRVRSAGRRALIKAEKQKASSLV